VNEPGLRRNSIAPFPEQLQAGDSKRYAVGGTASTSAADTFSRAVTSSLDVWWTLAVYKPVRKVLLPVLPAHRSQAVLRIPTLSADEDNDSARLASAGVEHGKTMVGRAPPRSATARPRARSASYCRPCIGRWAARSLAAPGCARGSACSRTPDGLHERQHIAAAGAAARDDAAVAALAEHEVGADREGAVAGRRCDVPLRSARPAART
jgi:hypothetical protein